MRTLLGAFLALALGIAIPLTFSARWFLYVLWIGICLAAFLLIMLSKPIRHRVPWKIERKDPELDEAIGMIVRNHVLRSELQTAFRRLTDMKEPSIVELRLFADNLARRLRSDGHHDSAKQVEVHLPDNADTAAIRARRDKLDTQLIRMLIWDEYQ